MREQCKLKCNLSVCRLLVSSACAACLPACLTAHAELCQSQTRSQSQSHSQIRSCLCAMANEVVALLQMWVKCFLRLCSRHKARFAVVFEWVCFPATLLSLALNANLQFVLKSFAFNWNIQRACNAIKNLFPFFFLLFYFCATWKQTQLVDD